MSDSGTALDRVLASSYLDGLAGLPVTEVRILRRAAEQEESELSYLRRLLHARIDILRAELALRTGDGAEPGGRTLVSRLPEVLSERRSAIPYGLGKHLHTKPCREEEHQARVDALVDGLELANLDQHGDADLAAAMASYQAEERRVSDQRSQVQVVVDRCGQELAHRYADGQASVDDLLPGSGR
jgi:hypothetical protein